jgi:hypothetical protein
MKWYKKNHKNIEKVQLKKSHNNNKVIPQLNYKIKWEKNIIIIKQSRTQNK